MDLDSNGAFEYTPNNSFSGTDSFTYRANDGAENSISAATVTITVAPAQNQAPIANADSYNTEHETALTVSASAGVLSNDTDDNTLTAVLDVGPDNGNVTLNSNGSFVYTPNDNFSGTDTFTYFANDGTQNSTSAAEVSIEVAPAQNQPPVANADSYSTEHETLLTVSASAGVLSNDTDPNTDSLTAVLLSGPSNGVLDLDSNGAFEYTPNNGFSGTDSFTYRANDGTENSISAATVTITVAPAQNQVPITNAFHRSGQTFLTWDESNQSVDYHVYRHNQPITSSNLGDATRLTDRWGPLDSNTSIHKIATDDASSRFIIEDLGDPLGDDTGLFVHTTSSEQQGNAWYAVTVVSSGVEETSIHANFGPFNESVQTPQPVLIRSENDGKGRIYTQYMDYANWNPTLNGYAYNFGVTFPQNYNPSTSYPLQVQLHAYGGSHKFETSTEFDWPVIQLFPQDPTDFAEGIIPTWWYGYSDSHDYRNTALTPDSGQIVNFTEQRVLDAVEFLIDDSDFNIDPNFTYAFGNSMGASGSLSLGIRYGNVFAGIYASQPMTNYETSPTFQEELVRLWGDPSINLPTVHRGSFASPLARYGAEGAQAQGVWDWMNHQEQLDNLRGEDMAFLITDVGKQDTTIDWTTQGKPWWLALNSARVGFAGVAIGNQGHSWMGFLGVIENLHSLFGLQFEDIAPWRYPLDLSFISITNASDSGNPVPADTGDDAYNQSILWSTPWINFDQVIVDSTDLYQISLRSTTVNQTADITPRRTSQFNPVPGTVCGWEAISLTDLSVVSPPGAALLVDSDSLATAEDVPILTDAGVRLTIDCSP